MNPEIAPILDVPEPPSLGAQGARNRYDHPGLEPLEKFGDILDTCTQGDGKRAENPAEELGWLATRSSRNCLRQPTFALCATVGTLRLNRERRVERATGIETD
jgi:hypothetical protein